MLLEAVQAHWRGAWRRWWGHRVGLLITYLGLLLAPFQRVGLGVAAIGAAWFLLGLMALAEERGVSRIAAAAGEFVEETLRLFVNTLSFARVGAFALGHAGLSLAIIDVAHAAGPVGYWIVLVLGNTIIIALEGLVVGVQTTRLVLFEFFIRFLTAGGREFKPLPPPEITNATLPRRSIRSTS
jgi:V/A-type H+-transporting ATPase subunit I